MKTIARSLVAGCALALVSAPLALAQTAGRAETLEIMPLARQWFRPGPSFARLSAVDVKVVIDGQVATTTLELSLTNPNGAPQEAEVLLPVPDGVSIRSLQFDGVGNEPNAKLLPREEARKIYDAITARRRDPALLEFVGYGMIRTSAFPIPANSTLKARITYDQVLTADGERVEYLLPRSEAIAANPSQGGVTWTFACSINSDRAIQTIYSPSHELSIDISDPRHAEVRVQAAQAAAPGPFRLAFVPEKPGSEGLSTTLVAYPDPSVGDGNGGFFLLLGALPAREGAAPVQNREVTLVLDRSGSMQGAKFEQARGAALAVIDGLRDGEFFNIIDYSDTIQSYEKQPIAKSADTAQRAKAYLGALRIGGGTNIQDAMLEAVKPAVADGALPMIVFLTDGVPTTGVTSEVLIREAIVKANSFERRVFVFGVGYDVNTPLLSSISTASRGVPTFVLPGENIEDKVSQVFRRLEGPRLASPALSTDRAVRELQPASLNDVFEGDQILVVGQYTSSGPVHMTLKGKEGLSERSFELNFDMARAASSRNGYIPRLWATRKIGYLLGEIREKTAGGLAASSPAIKELTDEVVRLSTRYGVMTEYTSFLATEPGMSLATDELRTEYSNRVSGAFQERLYARKGAGAMNQESNTKSLKFAMVPQSAAVDGYASKDMSQVRITAVQNVAQNALYRRGKQGQTRWVEAALLEKELEAPEQVVAFGTPDYAAIAHRLAETGQAGYVAMPGEVLVLVDGKRVLLQNTPD
ncbi:MAG: VWA domain-containing protein [Planctomycetes bacterium]|nr:VWA domain-containing protein [Planctomycetota bacterium]